MLNNSQTNHQIIQYMENSSTFYVKNQKDEIKKEEEIN